MRTQLKKISKIILVFLLFLFIFSCSSKTKRPDVSNISVDIKIHRFDLDLFRLKQNPDLGAFKEKYSDFLSLYSNKVIGLGNTNSSDYMDYLNKFLYDSIMTAVSEQVAKSFPNLDGVQNELDESFKLLKYYFPKKSIPQIYTQISGFNQSIVVAPNLIGISLDKYLGAECEFYKYLRTPMYARKNMIPKRIGQDIILAYALTEFPFQPTKDDLISNMIYQGKVRFFVQHLMPDKSEANVMKYSDEDLAWCKENESLMWGYIIEQKHLFSTDYRTIIKYINDGPFTPGMPQESPSRTGIWIGWQIVKKFMNKHPEYTLRDLMAENDYEKILRESSFQP
ncbi:gliding motility lipoprotein GldB [Ancylomarina longa]|nr:gliding motility lipoprotein GldB [Ancylomarina longa]